MRCACRYFNSYLHLDFLNIIAILAIPGFASVAMLLVWSTDYFGENNTFSFSKENFVPVLLTYNNYWLLLDSITSGCGFFMVDRRINVLNFHIKQKSKKYFSLWFQASCEILFHHREVLLITYYGTIHVATFYFF